MRRKIETAPKDGKLVILEDDAAGSFELGRWSTKEDAWVSEDGKPVTITPAHWLPLRRDERLEEDLRLKEEHLPQKETERCGSSDPRIQPIISTSARAALEWLAQRDAFAPRKDVTLPEIEPRPATIQPEPPVWSCLAKGDEPVAQKEAEWRALPDPLIQPILPLSSGGVALEWRAKEDVFTPPQDSAFLPIEPRTVASRPRARVWRRYAIFPIAAAIIALSLIVIYFRAPIATYVTQYIDRRDVDRPEEHPSQNTILLPIQFMGDLFLRAFAVLDERELQLRDSAATAPLSQEADREKTTALLQDVAAARQRLAENEVRYGKAIGEERDRSTALANELAAVQRIVETQVSRSNKTENESAQLKMAANAAASELQRERERADVLTRELAKVRQEAEAAAAVWGQKNEETEQLKQKAESAAAQLRLSLRHERQRAESLSSDLDKVRRDLEARAILASQKDDEAAQLKRVAETATAELQQHRDQAQALESELAKVRQNAEAQEAASRKTKEETARTKQIEAVASDFVGVLRRQKSDQSASNQVTEYAVAELKSSPEQVKPKDIAQSAEPARQIAGAAATEQPASAEANENEATELLVRAKALLGQGNIGAARAVLERAAEKGSAQAIFALAETYDPNVLATWRTYGTRGDVTKARDLYARAFDGGIKAAKDRSDALVVGDGGRKPAS